MRLRSLSIPILAGVVVVLLAVSGLTRGLDLTVRDAMLRLLPAREAREVVAVLVDESSLRSVGAWPWTRRTLASVVDAVRASGARGIVVDFLLPEERSGDGELARALSAMPSVLAAGTDTGRWILPAPGLRDHAEIAHAVLEVDHDGVLRRFASTKQEDGIALPALAMAAAGLARPAHATPAGIAITPEFRVRPTTVPVVPAEELLRGRSNGALEGKIVFLGATAQGLGDRVVTPVTRASALDPGVLVHAAMTESVLHGDLVRTAAPIVSGLLALLLVIGVEIESTKGGRTRALGLGALVVLPAILGFALIWAARVEIPTVTLVGVTGLAALVVEARSAYRVHRGAGAAVVALGGKPDAGASAPEDRVRQLEKIAEELARASAEDAESRRVLAHELKTPVTSIRGLTQLLGDFDLEEGEARRVAKLVVAETSRLQSMIEGLLDLERVRGRARREEKIDLGQLVERRVRPIREATGRTIDLDRAGGVEVSGDSGLLDRVIDNLVANAVKYSPENAAIAVRVSRGDHAAIVEVEDEGPGVPESEREAIFRRFIRGKGAEGTDGLGLGLAMVAEIASSHGGRVDVRDGRIGSIFRVSLPLAGSAARSEAV